MVDRSGGTGTLTLYDPGQDAARRFPDWVIRHRNLHGVPEVMCLQRKVILLEDEHDRSVRRCSLAHAVAHIDLEHIALNGVLSQRQETAADSMAARRLIHISHLADAMCWAESFAEAAHDLDVDERMLWVRITRLHPSERHFVRRVMDSKLVWA